MLLADTYQRNITKCSQPPNTLELGFRDDWEGASIRLMLSQSMDAGPWNSGGIIVDEEFGFGAFRGCAKRKTRDGRLSPALVGVQVKSEST